MKTASIMITVAVIALGVPAVAQQQQGLAGTITGINRLTGMVAITPTENGTVGSNAPASAPAPAEQFKVNDGALLDAVHAGDRVTYSVNDSGGVKTITKLDRQK
ncbi:MAG TPA: copper-binding protein [Bradyrhizobium sp.]|nr:copper-binding protein [Bradyrhizobium sp.]